MFTKIFAGTALVAAGLGLAGLVGAAGSATAQTSNPQNLGISTQAVSPMLSNAFQAGYGFIPCQPYQRRAHQCR